MVVDVLNQFDFFSAVPIDGSATYASISAFTKLPESVVRRILRHAFTLHLFAETSPGSGQVVHTAATAYMVKQPLMCSWVGMNCEEVSKGCVTVPEALRAYSLGKGQITQKPGECPTGRAFWNKEGQHPEKTVFDWFEEDGEEAAKGWRERRFGKAMHALAGTTTVTPEQILRGMDWSGLGEATVVDVSRGHAHISCNCHIFNLGAMANVAPGRWIRRPHLASACKVLSKPEVCCSRRTRTGVAIPRHAAT